MDALLLYSGSESEDEREDHLSYIAVPGNGVSSDNDYEKREETSTVMLYTNKTESLQPHEEIPITSAVDDSHDVADQMSVCTNESNLGSDFFNLVEETNFSVADELPESCETVGDYRQQLLTASDESSGTVDFWNTDVTCDWTHPEKIWHINSNPSESDNDYGNVKTANFASESAVSKIKGYSSRRRVTDISSESLVTAKLPVSARKSCFTVHHRIAPHLHSFTQSSNRIPRKIFRVLPGHSGTINRIHWCTAEYSQLLLSASMDATVRVWNVFSSCSDSDTCVRTMRVHRKAVKAARWSACGRQILSCSYDNCAKLTDVEHGSELCTFPHGDHVSCIKFSPTDHNLFVSGLTNLVLCWDKRCPSKPVRQYVYKDRFGQVLDLCFFHSGSQFLSCNDIVGRDSTDRTIMIWDLATGAVLSNQIFQERYTCTRLCVHPTEAKFFAQTNGDYIAEFSALPPYRINKCKRFEGHKVSGYSVGCDVSADGQLIVSGSSDSRLVVYDYRRAQTRCCLPMSDVKDVVLDVAWHPVLSSTVAAATWNGHVILCQ